MSDTQGLANSMFNIWASTTKPRDGVTCLCPFVYAITHWTWSNGTGITRSNIRINFDSSNKCSCLFARYTLQVDGEAVFTFIVRLWNWRIYDGFYHVHFYKISPQLSCGETCQIGTCFEESNIWVVWWYINRVYFSGGMHEYAEIIITFEEL